jgi:mannose-6-phosphate isomerase-like protein (cupin superfamily)
MAAEPLDNPFRRVVMSNIPVHALGPFLAFAHPSGKITPEAINDDFWTRRVLEFGSGQLISRFTTASAWPTWEMHPNGDELIIQISGITVFTIEGFEAPVTLSAGQFFVVPAGFWHTASSIEVGDAIYVTNGEGTQHRPTSL